MRDQKIVFFCEVFIRLHVVCVCDQLLFLLVSLLDQFSSCEEDFLLVDLIGLFGTIMAPTSVHNAHNRNEQSWPPWGHSDWTSWARQTEASISCMQQEGKNAKKDSDELNRRFEEVHRLQVDMQNLHHEDYAKLKNLLEATAETLAKNLLFSLEELGKRDAMCLDHLNARVSRLEELKNVDQCMSESDFTELSTPPVYDNESLIESSTAPSKDKADIDALNVFITKQAQGLEDVQKKFCEIEKKIGEVEKDKARKIGEIEKKIDENEKDRARAWLIWTDAETRLQQQIANLTPQVVTPDGLWNVMESRT